MSGGGSIRVAVAGGGIGGLAAAVALLRREVDVHVYEQAPALGEVGAGVMIMPNGLRVLRGLGVGDDIERLGARMGKESSYYRRDGAPAGRILTTDSSGLNGMYGMHRAELLATLANTLPPGVVHTGHRVVDFTQTSERARLAFDNGAEIEADAVIAADGIHSVLQKHATRPSNPVHSGSIAYRGLLSADAVPGWRVDVSQLWMGEGKHFLVFPVCAGRLINYVGFVPSEERTRESWSAPGEPSALAKEFRGWDPRLGTLLSQVSSTFWWGLYDREPLRSWTHGRLTLLGDAAHPMLPHAGQGANQALEDAAALAVMLANVARVDVPEALRAYEEVRRDRTMRVQSESRVLGNRYDLAEGDLDERDREMAKYAEFKLWLMDYDATAAAEAAQRAHR